MVESTIRSVPEGAIVAYSDVHASRGKAVRAEPIAALYEKGLVHHVGTFSDLEDEMTNWIPGDKLIPQTAWMPWFGLSPSSRAARARDSGCSGIPGSP